MPEWIYFGLWFQRHTVYQGMTVKAWWQEIAFRLHTGIKRERETEGERERKGRREGG